MTTYPSGASARFTDPSTSHEAAKRANATKLEQEVADVVRRYGPPRNLPMCLVEIHKHLPHHSIDALTPRPCVLVRKGILKLVGKAPRANRYGKLRSQQVYEYIHPAK